MVARSKIIDLNRTPAETEPIDHAETVLESASNSEAVTEYQELVDDSQNQELPKDIVKPRRNWAAISMMSLLATAFSCWTVFFLWAHLADFVVGITPAKITQLFATWAVPTCLIALAWLLVMRSSSREAARFGEVARLLREESLALEDRMRRMNGEIALARSFLAENARELETVGRASAQRLTDSAATLSSALSDTEERAQILQTVSNAAVANVEQLRNHLPVVTSAAKDATNQIGIAGNTAHSQIRAIVDTLNQVVESSQKTSSDLGSLETKLVNAADELEQRVAQSAENLASIVENSRANAATLFNELDKHMDDVEKRLKSASTTTSEQIDINDKRLSSILTELQSNIEKLQSTQELYDGSAQESIIRLGGFIEETHEKILAVDAEATDRIAQMAFAVNALVESNAQLSSKLFDNRELATDFMVQSNRLLELLGQVETSAKETLPDAFSSLKSKFDDSHSAFQRVNRDIVAADEKSAALTRQIAEIDHIVSAQGKSVNELVAVTGSHLQAQQAEVEALSAALVQTRNLIEEMVSQANEKLVGSMNRVREATREATDASREIVERELAEIAGTIAQRNNIALKSAIDEQINSLEIAMRESLNRNLALADQIEKRAASQLSRLDDMAANLEQRVAQVQNNFGGIDDEGFARRMALLTESLNSAAIDVAKLLSNDVTDTAWAAYLKGDRGVFTRRAVKLLDTNEVKIIASNYEEDSEFRDNVNRYIHDFEAMMRVLLSTRDGNAVGVTLLSSDVGKLYVALAQAIDRLRS
jgi:hypothetical protein